MAMNIYLLAGGGGHTGYAVALAEALIDLDPSIRDSIVFLVPRNDLWSLLRIKRRLGKGFPAYMVLKPRNPNEGIYRFLLRTPRSLAESYSVIKNRGLVIGTGSNFSLYPILVARIKHLEHVFSVEAIDRIYTSSKANTLLYKYLNTIILLHWREQLKNYPRGILTGPIVEKPLYEPRDNGYILVTTGSMGHVKLLRKLMKTSLKNIVVQTGRIDPKIVKAKKPEWIVFSYDPDIDKWIAGASIVIAHQGLTIAEAALSYNKPVVLAYNPDLPLTSGYKDSKLLAEKLNATLINPETIEPDELEEEILSTMNKTPPKYSLGSRTAAKYIYDKIINIT